MFSPSIDSRPAPALRTSCWFNTDEVLSLDSFKGRVVVLIAFQMLCPGCVAKSIPLALRLEQLFERSELAILGLHTVFEHHHVMTPDALEVFLAEYRIRFPVGVDLPDPAGADIPLTMQAYGMRGTPTLVLIDAEGRRRAQYFGAHDELALGAEIGALLAERDGAEGCTEGQCRIPA
ncbi:MAG: TlpA family protein disulfide reductase [Gammaproteobacteria bacterium]|nr:TlpA family protein disulfide reductase [Gammaproteobacteria bacterium]